MEALGDRRYMSQMTEDEIMEMTQVAFKRFKNPKSGHKTRMNKDECYNMFAKIVFDDMDFDRDLTLKIYDDMFKQIDFDEDGWVGEQELSNHFLKIAKLEGSIFYGF